MFKTLCMLNHTHVSHGACTAAEHVQLATSLMATDGRGGDTRLLAPAAASPRLLRSASRRGPTSRPRPAGDPVGSDNARRTIPAFKAAAPTRRRPVPRLHPAV